MQRKLIGTFIILISIATIGYTLSRSLYGTPDPTPLGLPDAGTNTAAVSPGTVAGTQEKLGKPKRLEIPKIQVNAHVQHVGVTRSGLMGVPSNFTDVGWYKSGTLPGARGSAVVAGHQDNAMGLDGVFKKLENLRVGDSVYMTDEHGKRLHFKVRKVELHPYNLKGAKLREIFADQSGKYLNLITCAGSWVQEIRTNDTRLIVFTELVE